MDAGQRNDVNVARMIWIVGSPILFTIGIVGNIMTIIVLSSKYHKHTSTTVFLTTLALADSLVMVLVQPRWWFIFTFGVDVRYLSNMFCKVQWFFAHFAGTFSTYVLVAVTIERVIVTLKPYKAKTWCNVNIAAGVSVSIALMLSCIYSHLFYGLKLFETQTIRYAETFDLNLTTTHTCNSLNSSNGTGEITRSTTFEDFEDCQLGTKFYPEVTTMSFEDDVATSAFNGNDSMRRNLNKNSTSINNNTASSMTTTGQNNMVVTVVKQCWYDGPDYGEFFTNFQLVHFCVYIVFPEMVFLISGIIIICKLYKTSQWRKQVTQDRSNPTGRSRHRNSNSETQATQITRTLLLVNIVFIVCTTPVFIYLVGRPYWVDPKEGMTGAQEIIWAICNQLYFLNHATNFALYFLCGARFRQQVVKTFSHKKRLTYSNTSISHVSST